MTNNLTAVFEQDAIFDGDPDFMPLGAVMNLLNYNANGGTVADLVEAKALGEMKIPRRYRVQLHLYVEEL